MDKEGLFIEFLRGFREYVVSYVNQNRPGIHIYELEVTSVPVTLYKENDQCLDVIVKNEGQYTVYLSTDKKTKYPLSAGERELLHINRPITFFCPEGVSSLAFIEN